MFRKITGYIQKPVSILFVGSVIIFSIIKAGMEHIKENE